MLAEAQSAENKRGPSGLGPHRYGRGDETDHAIGKTQKLDCEDSD